MASLSLMDYKTFKYYTSNYVFSSFPFSYRRIETRRTVETWDIFTTKFTKNKSQIYDLNKKATEII